jgi:acyl-CoA thioesterase FadM
VARITLEVPAQLPFFTDIAVRIGDINFAGHLGHDTIVSLLHEAYMRVLRAHGFTELDIDGFGLVMTDVTKNGLDFVYRLISKGVGKKIARARRGALFFDHKKRRVANVPKGFRAAFLSQ